MIVLGKKGSLSRKPGSKINTLLQINIHKVVVLKIIFCLIYMVITTFAMHDDNLKFVEIYLTYFFIF